MYTLLVTGDVPGASTYFNPLLQQSIVPCTSGTRPSSPPEGMLVYETDTDSYSSWNGSAWVTLGQSVTGAFTPALTASTTNPNVGTGAIRSGRYTLFGGKWCTCRGVIRFGTSPSAGSGQYLISLPVANATSFGGGVDAVGAGLVFDSSGTNVIQANFYVSGTGVTTMAGFAGDAQITNAAPWIWAASDYLSWTITYETA